MNMFIITGLILTILFGFALSVTVIIFFKKAKNVNQDKQSSQNNSINELEIFPYFINPKFITPAEKSFLHVLTEVTDGQASIFTKVNLGDLFHVEPKYWKSHRGKITQKHVDFLICNPKTYTPILAIELDDSSHNSKKAKNNDEFKNNLFKAANLPLLRVPVQYSYNSRDLKQAMQQAIKQNRSMMTFSEKSITAVPPSPSLPAPKSPHN